MPVNFRIMLRLSVPTVIAASANMHIIKAAVSLLVELPFNPVNLLHIIAEQLFNPSLPFMSRNN